MDDELRVLYRLNKPDIDPAAGMLVRAFRSYPLLRHSFPDEQQQEKVTPYFFRYSLYYGIRYGEIYATSPNLEGIAIWLRSEYFPVTFWRLLRSVPLSVILGFGRQGGGRLRYVGDYIDTVHKRLTPFKHWFLQAIGVATQFQEKGYAGRLLRPMLARLDEEGLPCYLETFDEKNVKIYEHFGFKVLEEAPIPKTGLTNRAMLREPRQDT
jgi:ribosomal protein S18 acetylase RimI-like enzyme